jgi:hypothetical protein
LTLFTNPQKPRIPCATQNSKDILSALEETLDSRRYQIFEMPKWRAPLMLAPGEAPPIIEEEPIAETPVDFGHGRKEFVRVFEGQALERVVSTFAGEERNLKPFRKGHSMNNQTFE